MDFRTKIPLSPQQPKIGYNSKILLLGSCFVEHIGRKLDYYKFETLQNPYGILFHPAAIANFLKRVNSQKNYSEEEVFYHNERWHSFEAHSSLSSTNREEVLHHLNSGIEKSRKFLEKASHIIITLGTSWAYKNVESGKTVANCHKLPQKNFRKELTDVKADLAECIKIIKSLNPEITIIFTVSPVRHLKDGFVENQHSKAHLISALHNLLNIQEHIPPLGVRGLFYFPSYELMMDELRDYRFYAEDMIHPNQTAIDYIWEKFIEVWMDQKTISTMEEVEKIQKGLEHKAFDKNSEAHREFQRKLQLKIENLRSEYPRIRF